MELCIDLLENKLSSALHEALVALAEELAIVVQKLIVRDFASIDADGIPIFEERILIAGSKTRHREPGACLKKRKTRKSQNSTTRAIALKLCDMSTYYTVDFKHAPQLIGSDLRQHRIQQVVLYVVPWCSRCYGMNTALVKAVALSENELVG